MSLAPKVARLEEDEEVRLRMNELKRQLGYLDKTNWFFERDTVDFSQFVPFEQDHQYTGAATQKAYTIRGSYHSKQ